MKPLLFRRLQRSPDDCKQLTMSHILDRFPLSINEWMHGLFHKRTSQHTWTVVHKHYKKSGLWPGYKHEPIHHTIFTNIFILHKEKRIGGLNQSSLTKRQLLGPCCRWSSLLTNLVQSNRENWRQTVHSFSNVILMAVWKICACAFHDCWTSVVGQTCNLGQRRPLSGRMTRNRIATSSTYGSSSRGFPGQWS